MKRTLVCLCNLMFLALLTCTVAAQEMEKKPATKADKPAKVKAAKPTADPDILKCIEERFANAKSLKDKPPSASVSNGVATLTGEAKNGGTKGGATRIAKSCGAKEIKNEMSVLPGAKPAKEKKIG
jgi:osmotically-inducible protein OsmY